MIPGSVYQRKIIFSLKAIQAKVISFLKDTIPDCTFFRNTLIYGFELCFWGISFFLIPLYTRLLRPEDYGHLELLNTFTFHSWNCLSLSIIQFSVYGFFSSERQPKPGASDDSVLSIYLEHFPESIPAYLLIILWFNHEFFWAPSASYWVYFSITTYLNFPGHLYILVLKLSEKVKRVTILQIVLGVLSMSWTFYLCIIREQESPASIWANLICTRHFSSLSAAASGISLDFWFFFHQAFHR